MLTFLSNFVNNNRRSVVHPVVSDENDCEYTEVEYMIRIRAKARESDMYIFDEIDYCIKMLRLYQDGTYKRSYELLRRHDRTRSIDSGHMKKIHIKLFLRSYDLNQS